jgi:hypothetical protein
MRHRAIWTSPLTAIFAAALAVTGAASCQKDEPVAQTKSIGTMSAVVSRAERAAEVCGPTSIADPASRLWASLPPRLQSAFNASDHRPLMVANVQELCGGILAARGLDGANTSSCYKVDTDEANSPHPRMLLSQDPTLLNQTFVMTAMLTYMDFYFDSLFGPSSDNAILKSVTLMPADKQLIGFTSQIRAARQALAQAYLDDMKAAGLTTPLQAMSATFKTSVDALPESLDYQNHVLVNFADSYYCNEKTARELNINFLARSRGAFMPLADFFGAPWFASAPKNQTIMSH